jgi:transposase
MKDGSITRYNAGVDFGSEQMDVKLAGQYQDGTRKILFSRRFENKETGFKNLRSWLQDKCRQKEVQIRISCEATGVYHERCCYFLNAAGYYVTVEVPSRVKSYKKSGGFNSKNDNIDATALAYMGLEKNLRKWEPVNSFYYELRMLTRHYESIQQMHTSACNQLHAQQAGMRASKLVVKQLKAAIRLYKKQLVDLEKGIKEKINLEPEVKRKINDLTESLKGVGIMTVAVVVAETNGFSWFTNRRQVVKYAGYDVVENQSGKRTGKTRISKMGNAHIRRALYFPAINLVEHEVKPFKDKYERIYERTRIKMKGYTALQKDLLLLLFTLWKKDEKFDPNYQNQQNKKVISID